MCDGQGYRDCPADFRPGPDCPVAFSPRLSPGDFRDRDLDIVPGQPLIPGWSWLLNRVGFCQNSAFGEVMLSIKVRHTKKKNKGQIKKTYN